MKGRRRPDDRTPDGVPALMPGRPSGPNMKVYLASQIVSMTSDNILWLAVVMWVGSITGSPASASLSLLMFTLGTLASPLAGVVVDRMKRRRLILLINGASALLVLTLLDVENAGQLTHVYGVMFGYGLANAILEPAHGALVQEITPAEEIRAFSNALLTAQQIARLVTPLLGFAIFTAGGLHLVCGLCAAGFILDSIILLSLSVHEIQPARTEQRFLHEVLAGAKHIASNQCLREAMGWVGCVVFALGVARSSIFSIAHNDGLPKSDSLMGVIPTAQALGAIAMGLCVPWLLKTVADERLVRVSVIIAALGLFLQSFPVPMVIVVGAMLGGISVTLVNVGAATLYLRHTPSALMGRTDAALLFIVFLCQAAAGLFCVSGQDYRFAIWGTSAALVCINLSLAYRRSRQAKAKATRVKATRAKALEKRPGAGAAKRIV
jgi:hypothetical protein